MRWIYTKGQESISETKFDQIYNEGLKIGKQFKPGELKPTIYKLTSNSISTQERIKILIEFEKLSSIKLPDLLISAFDNKDDKDLNDLIIAFISGLHNGSLENK